jgi:hypothetical protein
MNVQELTTIKNDNMKVINLDSKYDLTQAQISFAESVILLGEYNIGSKDDSISALMEQIPVFLLSPESMFDENSTCDGIGDDIKDHIGWWSGYGKDEVNDCQLDLIDLGFGTRDEPPTKWLGFYIHSYRILDTETPIIGLCPERIMKCAHNNEDLMILIAKVLIHELAHARMKPHTSVGYSPIDEFYKWMEEPMANLITLNYFKNYVDHINNRDVKFASLKPIVYPFDFVEKFISNQPPNYRLGLDLFKHKVGDWRIWRDRKIDIKIKHKEKDAWLKYVEPNVGRIDEKILDELFKDLHKK